MGAKIQIKNESVKNFGGFFSFVDHFRKDGMDGIVDKTLVSRSIFTKYSNSDISLSLAAIFLTGGSCIEDSNRLSRIFTENSHGYRFCSADTILRMIKAASKDCKGFASKAGAKYQFGINEGLCGMLLDGLLQSGQVLVDGTHVFDYDNQFIPTEKYDAKHSYKGSFGYFPGIAQIDGLPYYVEVGTETPMSSSSKARLSRGHSRWPRTRACPSRRPGWTVARTQRRSSR